jgi:hypothetical protein
VRRGASDECEERGSLLSVATRHVWRLAKTLLAEARMGKYLLIAALTLGCVAIASTGNGQKPPTKKFEEIVRFEAAEARQGVAVDAQHFYAVTDLGIGKYDKKTGKLVAKWESPKGGPFIHLDSGVILDGKLYASHSNYPQEPMTSSVEIWDAVTMQHIGSHSFGIMWGSCTWIDRHDGAWWWCLPITAGFSAPANVPTETLIGPRS